MRKVTVSITAKAIVANTRILILMTIIILFLSQIFTFPTITKTIKHSNLKFT